MGEQQTGRTFVRGLTSTRYSLEEWRSARLSAPRVRAADEIFDDGRVGHSGHSVHSSSRWRLGPGDDPFLTQSIQVHHVDIEPHGSNKGHGHQNEAAFFVLSGRGHELHDGRRYEWGPGDLVMVHVDSVHRHFNDSDEPARLVVFKAKAAWMFLGLVQQGTGGEVDERFEPRRDWSELWTPGAQEKKKIVRSEEMGWQQTAHGDIKSLCGPEDDVRAFSVDVYMQRIAPGGSSSRQWHMADEVAYVLAGSGRSLQWEVEAEIDDRYYARVARRADEYSFRSGDLVYVPPNHVHQYVNDGDDPLVFLVASSRIFRSLGYDSIVHLEDAR